MYVCIYLYIYEIYVDESLDIIDPLPKPHPLAATAAAGRQQLQGKQLTRGGHVL